MPPPIARWELDQSHQRWLLLTLLLVIVSVPPLLKMPPPSPRANPVSLLPAVLLMMLLFSATLSPWPQCCRCRPQQNRQNC